MADEPEKQLLSEGEPRREKKKSSAAAVIALVLLLLLIIAIGAIAWMAYGVDAKEKHLDDHHKLFKENAVIYQKLQDDFDDLKNTSYHKEKEFNETVDRLEEDIMELVETFLEKEKEHNETVANLTEKMANMTDLMENFVQEACDRPEVAAALTSGAGSPQTGGVHIIGILLSLYMFLYFVNAAAQEIFFIS